MAFDPTLPFEVVEEPKKRKEGFDPSAPFEVENVATSDPQRSPSLFFRRQDEPVTELNPDGSVPEGGFDPTKPFDVEQAPQPQANQEGGGYGTLAARAVPLATAQMFTGLERMTDAAFYNPAETTLDKRFGVLNTPKQLRETIPVRPDVQQSIGGQFIEGLGQVAVGAGLGIATGGLGNISMALAGAGQLFEEGYQDQIQSGADENTARQNAFKYTASSLPLEFLGDKFVVEGLFRGMPSGLIDRGMTVMDAVKRVVAYGAIGSQVDGGTEAAQQVLLNTLAVDPNRKLSDGVLDSYLVGSLVGGTASTATSAVGYGRAVADPENQARVLQTRVEEQARQAAAQPDALARAANIPSSARLENFNVTSRDDGKNQTKATYRDEDGKRFTVTVQEDQSKVDTQYLALPEPRPMPTGEGTPVPVGTQVVPRMDRQTRQIVAEERPVTGRVITPPQQLQSGEEVRLNVVDPTNGQADFLVGTVTEDGQGVQISRIPENLQGLSQQATDATTATQPPRRMPAVGDVVPLSVAERDFRSYGFRPEGAWYSNMAYRPEPAAQTEPFTTQSPAEPRIPQAEANQQTLSAAQRALVPPAPSRQKTQRVRAPLPESYIKASVRQVTPAVKQEAARGGSSLINSLRRVAPRGAAELEVISGPAPQGTPSGAVGSYNPRRAMVWLSDKIASFPQQVKEWTHELGHVHWDTLPTPVKRAVATLRAAELSRRTGPLFNERGGLRDGISPRVLSSELQADSIAPWDTLGLREYYSERLMAENAAWSLRRGNANSTFGRIAEGVRSFVERVGSSLGKGDAVTNSFRAWADLGPRYGIQQGGTERVESNMDDSKSNSPLFVGRVRFNQNEVLQEVASKEVSKQERGTYPRYSVVVDGETLYPKTPSQLAKVLDVISGAEKPRVFRNAGKGVTIDFDKDSKFSMRGSYSVTEDSPRAQKWADLGQKIKENRGGFTIDPDTLELQSGGYFTAISLDTEFRVDISQSDRKVGQDVRDYLIRTRQLIRENPQAFLGGWVDEDTKELVLDISYRTNNPQDALDLARRGGQKAIFDANTFRTIRTDVGLRFMRQRGMEVVGTPQTEGLAQRNMAVAAAPRLAGDIRSKPRYRPSSFKDILPYIDAREAGVMKFRKDTQAKIEEIFNAAPQDIDYEVAARMGMIKKGWYARAAKILNQIFGDDADLFIGVLAASSPRQTVRENLAMALRVWDAWQKAGRPNDYQTIVDDIARPLTALESRYMNVARHLTGEDMSEDSRKVKSFYDNSGGNLYSVTLDTWMALFGGVDQSLFGTKSGYAAHAAKVRRVAKRMGLQPAEVQETVWSFFKTLVDSSTGGVTPKELIFDLTDTDVYSTPEFYDLALRDPEIRQQLEQHAGAGVLDRIDNEQLSRGGETPLGIPVSSLAGPDSQRVLERIAGRAVEARTRLAKAEGEVSDPFSIRGEGQTSANLGELEALVPSNYTPAVEAQIAGNTQAAMTKAGYAMSEPSKNEHILKTRRLVFDMNADFRDFIDRMRREGRTVAESSDYYTIEQNMHGVQGAMLEDLFSSQDAIIEKIRKDKLNIDEVGEYLLAKHAPERNAYLEKTRNVDNGSGISDQEAAQILQRLAPKRAQFEEISRMVQDLNRNKLAFLEKSGMISSASRTALQTAYPNYVSLAQEEDVVLGPALREATGRFSKPSQMLAFTFMGQQRAVVIGNKNLSLLALSRMVNDFPDNGLVEPLAEFRGDETPISDNVIKFRENGEIKYLRILKPELENTFHMKSGLTDRFLLDPVGKATRFIASMATTYNPAFPIPNVFRDVQTGLFNLASTEIAKQQKAYISNIPTAIKAIWIAESKAAKRGEPTSVSPQIKRMMDYYDEFSKSGGRMVFMGLRDAEYYAGRINRMVSGSALERAPRALISVYTELLDHVNASLENASRLSAYVTAREMGLSTQRAANIARNLTTNFTKKGQAKFLNKMYAFFNASIQGNARMLESLRTTQGKVTAASFVLAGIVMSMVMRALDDEDEKTGVKDMDKLPEYVKSTNILAAFPNSANYLKMPLAYGWNVFYYLGVKIADAMPKDLGGKGESPFSAGLSWVGSVVNAFNPTGGGEDLITSIYPTVLQPFTEILVNKDFAGRPIYPQDVSFDPNQTPYAFRHWANVNPATKFISEGIARLTGGTEARPSGAERLLGKFGADRLLSPESLDHVFSAVFSGPYGLLSQLFTTGVGLSVGKEIDPNKLPVFRRFYGEVGPSNDAMMYSQARGSVFMAFDDLQIAQKNRDAKQVQYVKENYAPELSVISSFRKADTYLRNINTELKAARTRGDQKAMEKLEKQRNDIHREVLGMYLNEVKRFDAGKL